MPWPLFWQFAAFGFYSVFMVVMGSWIMLNGGAGRSPFQGMTAAVTGLKSIFRRGSGTDNGQILRKSVEPPIRS